MKTYEGERGLSGALVTVDGTPLPPRLDLHSLNRTGFEWTYAGPGPQQLALAPCKPFMQAVVAHLDNAWAMTSDEVAAAVADLGKA